MVDLVELACAAQAKCEQLTEASGRFFSSQTIDEFIREYSGIGEADHYRFVPDRARALVQVILDAWGAEAVDTFLQAAILHSVVLSIQCGSIDSLTPRVRIHQAKQFSRIVLSLQSSSRSFSLNQDLFLKEMGIASLRLLAGASQLIDVRCGIPRSIVFRQGLRRALPAIGWFVGRLRGFRPFMQVHTHDLYLDEFNEQGWAECYRCCAEICEANPKLLGMFGSSWFYDPQVCKISPRLSYLQAVPASGGAKFLYVATGGHSISLATATSSSRRVLYESGEYMPAAFMLVWASRDLVSWAQNNDVIPAC